VGVPGTIGRGVSNPALPFHVQVLITDTQPGHAKFPAVVDLLDRGKVKRVSWGSEFWRRERRRSQNDRKNCAVKG